MEEIHQTALAYFNNLSEKEKKKARKFFQKIDANKDGSISLDEYLKYLKKEGFPEISNPKVFEELDKDNNGCLDFEEAITLFYICASERPLFCDSCQEYLKGIYFTCAKCFDSTSQTYDLCITCFQEKKYQHEHAVFCDNYALLASKKTTTKSRMKKLSTHLAVHAATIPIGHALCTIM